jgi:hypothetical protein
MVFVCKCDETKLQKANQIKYNSILSKALLAELHSAETNSHTVGENIILPAAIRALQCWKSLAPHRF